MGTQRGGVFLDISHIKKDTILSRLPTIYKQILNYQKIDISKEPIEVAPTAHYSMGGVYVKADNHETSVEGLFAVGEVAGGLHGANRLGGNSLAEILVFGKIAGKYASIYSKKSKSKPNPLKSLKAAHENIDKKIKQGNNKPFHIQRELQKIMWEHCGVIKDKKSLEKGLEKLVSLKNETLLLDISVSNNDNREIVDFFDLEASLITAESTLLSSHTREETRGAHNRSDFPQKDKNDLYNVKIALKNNQLNLEKSPSETPHENLLKIIKKTKEIKNFDGKLIE